MTKYVQAASVGWRICTVCRNPLITDGPDLGAPFHLAARPENPRRARGYSCNQRYD